MFILSKKHVTERTKNGDKTQEGEYKTGDGGLGMVSTRVYTYNEKKGRVWVKSFVVRYKCPALRRPRERKRGRGLYNDMGTRRRGYGLVNTAVWTS